VTTQRNEPFVVRARLEGCAAAARLLGVAEPLQNLLVGPGGRKRMLSGVLPEDGQAAIGKYSYADFRIC
jgi:hypothetical protein